MLVKDWMNKNVLSLSADDTVQHAIKLQKKNFASILLVYDNGKLVGVLAKSDLKKAVVPELIPMGKTEAFNMVADIKVKQVMSVHPLTVTPEHTMDEAAEIILKNQISGVPVADAGGNVLGIVSRSDLLEFLGVVTGGDKIGFQLNFSLLDKPMYISEIIDVIRDYDGRIWNMTCHYHGVKEGYRHVSLKIYNITSENMKKVVERVKEKTSNLYMIDYVEGKRGEA